MTPPRTFLKRFSPPRAMPAPVPSTVGRAVPRPFGALVRRKVPLLAAAVALLALATLLSLLYAPTLSQGFSAPVAQRVFYLHFGAALTSYIAFTFVFLLSAAYLRSGKPEYDSAAAACAALALLFTTMVLVAGPLWGWAEWGVAWRFEDARLDTYLVLALVFVGYFALRRQLPAAEARARTSAMYALVGFVLVPLSYLSIYLFQSLHPKVISPGGQGVGGQGAVVMLVALSAFVLLFLALLGWRLDVAALERRVAALQGAADS